MNTTFIESAKACLENGDRLLFDAEMLYDSPRALPLAVIAEEEFAKGFLLWLVANDVVPWNPAVWRTCRDHSCKHLLTLVMEYSHPDSETILAQIEINNLRHRKVMALYDQLSTISILGASADERKELMCRREKLCAEIEQLDDEARRERLLPNSVNDAIHILRNEKIRMWVSVWRCDEKYDRFAQKLADGARDREKQNALYVNVTRAGQVANRPETIREETVEAAREHAKKLRWFLSGLIERSVDEVSSELEAVIDTFRLLFASQEELKRMFPHQFATTESTESPDTEQKTDSGH